MKKVYDKPMVLIENFAVSESIAAGCGLNPTMADASNCEMGDFFLNNLWDMGVFKDGLGCSVPMDDSFYNTQDEADKYNGFCSHASVMHS